MICAAVFQFTRPRGARPRSQMPRKRFQPRFNSRAHEGRDLTKHILRQEPVVSIHAPTRGATPTSQGWFSEIHGFNSRAHEGRDDHFEDFVTGSTSFNSRAHEGRDGGYCIILLYWNARDLFRELAGTHRPVRHQSLLFVMHATLSPFNTTSQNSLFHCQRATTVRLTPCTA